MYMDQNKNIYLNTLKPNSNVYLLTKRVFESIEEEEKNRNIEICNISPDEYGYIIIKSISSASYKFSDFYQKINVLLKYRNYCWVKGLIDPEKFYLNNGDYNYLSDLRKLYSIFRKLVLEERDSQEIESPMMLYRLLQHHLYGEQSNYDHMSFYDMDVKNNIIPYEDIVILYLLLYYHGMTNEQISMLTTENIIFSDKENAIIECGCRQIKLHGEFCGLLKKRLSVEIVNKRGRFYDLDKDYVFAFESDKTQKEKKKRVELLYFKYDRDKSKVENFKFPSNKEIRFNGILYQMCVKTKECKYDDARQIIELYNNLSGEQIKNKTFAIEIEEMYKERFDYLMNNGWPL